MRRTGREKGWRREGENEKRGRGRLFLGSKVPQELNGFCSSQIKGADNSVRTKNKDMENMSVARAGDSIVF